MSELVLSLFPGIGLLDRGFELAGFCVVRGPDLIWGGDIRSFNPPLGKFDGVIGGSPCQDFSKARRAAPTGNGLAMIEEFKRVVRAAQPNWWLLENVPGVPDVEISGYNWQRIDLYAHEFGSRQRRLRHIQFGSCDRHVLVIDRGGSGGDLATVTASDTNISISEASERQGMDANFDIPSFKRSELRKAIGNGVPVPMAHEIAKAVANRIFGEMVSLCGCGCARPIRGSQTYARGACRMREMRRRKKSSLPGLNLNSNSNNE